MDSLIKILTTIGIIAALGFVGKIYYDFFTALKTEKELIKTQANDVNEKVAEWVEKSTSLKCLETESKRLSEKVKLKKEALEAEEERKMEEKREKITFKDKIPHDGKLGGTIAITLDASKSTPTEAGDDMTYNWKSVDGKVQIEDQGAEEISFDAEAGQYQFELTVTDSYGASSNELRIVDISEESNQAPRIIIEKK